MNTGKYKKHCQASGIKDLVNDWVVYTECSSKKVTYLNENTVFRCNSCNVKHLVIEKRYNKLIYHEILGVDRLDILNLMPTAPLIT